MLRADEKWACSWCNGCGVHLIGGAPVVVVVELVSTLEAGRDKLRQYQNAPRIVYLT